MPWHRGFVAIFGRVLREELRYRGPIPYWDWSADYYAPDESQIWSDFGGVGNPVRLPFGDLVTNFPTPDYKVSRDSIMLGKVTGLLDPQIINTLASSVGLSYDQFLSQLLTFSNQLHTLIGGTMGTFKYAGNDPLSILHLKNIDRIWAFWQQLPGNQWKFPFPVKLADKKISAEKNPNLDITLPYFGLMDGLRPITIRDVMHTNGGAQGLMCFTYAKTIKPLHPRPKKKEVNEKSFVGRVDDNWWG